MQALPPEAAAALARLGEHLALARLERGDPGVSAGILATALWMVGRTQALGDLAAPELDAGALELDIRAARRTRAVRSQASTSARLARKPGST